MDTIRARKQRRRGPGADSRQRLQPTLMALEARELLSTFTVTSTADDGSSGTLRLGDRPSQWQRRRRHDRILQPV